MSDFKNDFTMLAKKLVLLIENMIDVKAVFRFLLLECHPSSSFCLCCLLYVKHDIWGGNPGGNPNTSIMLEKKEL